LKWIMVQVRAGGTRRRPGRYPAVNIIAKLVLAVLVVTHAMRSAAVAQAQAADPKACSDRAGNSPNQDLSNRLDASNGVICPPSVDPGIKAPTPEAGRMPVIPPPGSPGGDPTVQPK
jgi:hypothetical protein